MATIPTSWYILITQEQRAQALATIAAGAISGLLASGQAVNHRAVAEDAVAALYELLRADAERSMAHAADLKQGEAK